MITDAVAELVQAAHIEVIPLLGSEEAMLGAPPAVPITITCSPKFGLERTLLFTEIAAAAGRRVIPHLAARQVRDETMLREILDRLGAAGVPELFVIGGDATEPAGTYAGSAELLEAMSGLPHGISRIGVGCYPEGHPAIPDDRLLADLLHKQKYAGYMVSQLCFDATALLRWISSIRAAGVTLPLRIGVAGPVQMRKLIELSMRIGVGSSVRYLTKQHGLLGQLFRGSAYRPERLLARIFDGTSVTSSGIEGLHVFSFNQLALAAGWQRRIAASADGAELA
ncbi:methylenetetrahydrofolate reductase [Amycolatopsis pithecellobii]|uniref:Methylenetetrahydrofolate reductase n=1 Tax=Amycolatopsis pithecellobii TaxID=664692 RepID=A0A6N7Z637_9PSEU|nr:methylenetetrahydrofolate reductase [Amycolatopsis pithecellobii]MTD57279.1 5,10-methylenetetrahydrofolate reductase [Amycolatopsis pithecellobii]